VLATGPVKDIVANMQSGTNEGEEVWVQLLQGPDLADRLQKGERLLLEQPHVKKVAVDGPRLRVRYSGSEADAAALLGVLVGAQLGVCQFQRHAAGLEEAFMTMTRGRVQ
jgi:hypothetical protein